VAGVATRLDDLGPLRRPAHSRCGASSSPSLWGRRSVVRLGWVPRRIVNVIGSGFCIGSRPGTVAWSHRSPLGCTGCRWAVGWHSSGERPPTVVLTGAAVDRRRRVIARSEQSPIPTARCPSIGMHWRRDGLGSSLVLYAQTSHARGFGRWPRPLLGSGCGFGIGVLALRKPMPCPWGRPSSGRECGRVGRHRDIMLLAAVRHGLLCVAPVAALARLHGHVAWVVLLSRVRTQLSALSSPWPASCSSLSDERARLVDARPSPLPITDDRAPGHCRLGRSRVGHPALSGRVISKSWPSAIADSASRRWSAQLPDTMATTDLDEVLLGDADVVDILSHPAARRDRRPGARRRIPCPVQKPIARSLEECDRMMAAAGAAAPLCASSGLPLFRHWSTPKCRPLGEIGDRSAPHEDRRHRPRGLEVPMSSMAWQFEQALDGRAVGLRPRLAPARAGRSDVRPVPGSSPGSGHASAPILLLRSARCSLHAGVEHDNGVRGVLDITLAPNVLRSDFYPATSGSRSPEVAVRSDASISACGCKSHRSWSTRRETRSFHALDDTCRRVRRSMPTRSTCSPRAAGDGVDDAAPCWPPLEAASVGHDGAVVAVTIDDTDSKGGARRLGRRRPVGCRPMIRATASCG